MRALQQLREKWQSLTEAEREVRAACTQPHRSDPLCSSPTTCQRCVCTSQPWTRKNRALMDEWSAEQQQQQQQRMPPLEIDLVHSEEREQLKDESVKSLPPNRTQSREAAAAVEAVREFEDAASEIAKQHPSTSSDTYTR